ncbi:WD40-repeat-containing domain protein [Mycena olivaceomarginata]|nr:WD40-repeat-containing domain protein [Mycena olivaceomarginata]
MLSKITTIRKKIFRSSRTARMQTAGAESSRMHPGPNQSLTLNTTTPGAENSLMHLGPNQSLTLNTTTPGAESSLMHLDPNQSLTLNTTTPGAESSLMHLGPNQSLTLNTTVHGGIGGHGGFGHGQGRGGSGGIGEGPTVNYNFSLEQTQDLTSKLSYAKDAEVRASKACLPGTRVELLARIQNWALHPEKQTLLLYGAAGTGKSAIVHTVARELDSEKLAFIPFFAFNRSVQNRCSSQLIPTWAKKLAELHPPYQAYLHGLKLSDLESTDLVHQQDVLLLKGLASLTNCGKPVVFIIDALDECPKDEAYHLLRMLGQLICEPTLPVFARFLFTYRSHGEILEIFKNAASILHINIDDQQDTVEDIYKFVDAELHNTKVQNMAGDVAKAAQKVFECAAVLCRELTATMRTSARKKIIKTLQGGQITSLYSSYRAILEIHLRGDDIQVFQQVMSWVFTVQTPQTRQVLHEIAIGLLPEESNSDPDDILTWLGSLLSGTTSQNERILPLHTSFRDFLMDKEQSGEFGVNLGPNCHQEISMACLKIMNSQLRFNICGLKTSFALNSEAEDLSERVKECISPGLHYACLTGGYHLQNALPIASEVDSVAAVHQDIITGVTYFLENKFLFWLEAHSCMETGKDGPGTILPQFLEWAMGIGENQIQTVLLDYIQFEKRFRQGYMISAPQVYISGLVFAPQDSIIARQYRSKFHNLVQASGSLDTVWPPSETLVIHEMTEVWSVAFSPDGLQVASGSGYNIRIWNVRTGQQVGEALVGHADWVCSVAFSPDGSHIASGSSDKTICLWDSKTGQQVGETLVGHTGCVWSIAFSPDGSHIASGSDDKTIRLWDVKTRQQVGKPLVGYTDYVRSVAFSPDGNHIASGSFDVTICLWDVKTGQQVGKPLVGHTGCVHSIAFSPDGNHIASGSDDKTIRLWDVKTGQQLGKPLVGHTRPVQSVAFSPDGSHIASGSFDVTICLWDVKTGQQLGKPLVGHTGCVHSIGFSPNGSHIASGSNDTTIRLWDVKTGQQLGKPLIGHTHLVHSVAFSPDGSHIASGSRDKTIHLWDLKTGQQLGEPLVGHTDYVLSVAFSPDGSHIASGSADKTICLWDVRTGQQLGEPLVGHTHSVWSVAFSPDGGHIASGSDDKTICLWDVKTGRQVGKPLVGHTHFVWSVAFSPDGSRIVSGSVDRTIRLWDVNTGQQVGEPLVGHTGSGASVAFSPDGSHIASGSSDKTIRLWDIKTGQQVGEALIGHTNYIQSVAFSPDGSHIASGSDDKTVRLWDVKTGQQVGKPLVGHTHYVRSVAFSPDGSRIASGSDDKTIHLWDIMTEQPTKSPAKHNDVVPSLILSIEDRWFQTTEHKCHALWVPHAFRQHVFNYHPWSMIFCAQPQINLEFTNAALGPNWVMIQN